MPGETDEVGAPPMIPASVRDAILNRPDCDICGGAVLTPGRIRHVICQLIEREL